MTHTISAATIDFSFTKADPTGGFVRGWALVSSVDGVPVVDWQGDVISIDELRKAAHAFIVNARVAKAMHEGARVGEIVESVLVDDDLAKALGITNPRRGWFIAMRVDDPAVRKRIRSGELRAFSIGGKGRRTTVW